MYHAQQICTLEEYCLWPCLWQMRIKCARGRLVIQTPRDVRHYERGLKVLANCKKLVQELCVLQNAGYGYCSRQSIWVGQCATVGLTDFMILRLSKPDSLHSLKFSSHLSDNDHWHLTIWSCSSVDLHWQQQMLSMHDACLPLLIDSPYPSAQRAPQINPRARLPPLYPTKLSIVKKSVSVLLVGFQMSLASLLLSYDWISKLHFVYCFYQALPCTSRISESTLVEQMHLSSPDKSYNRNQTLIVALLLLRYLPWCTMYDSLCLIPWQVFQMLWSCQFFFFKFLLHECSCSCSSPCCVRYESLAYIVYPLHAQRMAAPVSKILTSRNGAHSKMVQETIF